MKPLKFLFPLTLILSTNLVLANSERSIGVLVNESSSIYLDTNKDNVFAPFLSYDSDTFFIKQRSIGYHLTSYLDASIAYKDNFFDPDDSTNADMQLLDRRKGGVYAKGSVRASIFNATIEQDISGRHDGYTIQAGVHLPLYSALEAPLIVRGSIDYIYMDEQMSEYLYSVSASESARTSGRIANFSIKDTTAIKYGLRTISPITNNLNIVTILNYVRYSDEVGSSPIVSKNYHYSGTILANYTF